MLGGVITVMGLTFLALFAFSSGLLGPRSGTTLAAGLSAVLFAAALPMHGKFPRGAVAPSLLVTGTLGGLATTWVAVFLLDLFPELAGAALTVALCAAAMGIAYRWQNQPLAITFTLLAPLFIFPVAVSELSGRDYEGGMGVCVGLLGALALAARYRRRWFALSGTGAAVLAIGLLLTVRPLPALLVGSVGALVLLGLARTLPRPSRTQLHLETYALLAPTLIALAPAQWWFGVPFIATITLIGLGAAMTSLGAGSAPGGPVLKFSPNTEQPTVADAYVVLANTSLVLLVLALAQRITASGWFAVPAVVLATGIAFFAQRLERFVPIVTTTVGVLCLFPHLAYSWVDYPRLESPLSLTVLLCGTALALTVANVGRTIYVHSPATARSYGWVFQIGALICLIVGSSAIPALSQFVVEGRTSFNVSHVVISVLWIILGVGVLHQGRTSLGVFLAVMASLKLVLYDLSALSGIIKVVAFMLCGLLLLGGAAFRERQPKVGEPPQAGDSPQADNSRQPSNFRR
ncbi:hypothetical protein DLJ54_03745 [Corynebacterium heidelbergense]|uniref:DUF2339 domain-containing protein n=1 Tax=Corynebacterium heidelbergense TaxID=2055947 RepID=A0A364V6R8_9CORY|nr:hypothetical protein DLJ54_03745 [Corynebacterium heidelbergense]